MDELLKYGRSGMVKLLQLLFSVWREEVVCTFTMERKAYLRKVREKYK